MARANIRAAMTAIAATCGMLMSHDAWADGMRCGNQLVSNGDTQHTVRSKCGAPQNVEQRTETQTLRRRVVVPCREFAPRGVCMEDQEYTVTLRIETWTYDFGTSRLVHYATFVDGALREVQTGGYGTRPDTE